MAPPPNNTASSSDDPFGGMDPMAWLESLAKRQGANPDELTTAADIDVPLPPAADEGLPEEMDLPEFPASDLDFSAESAAKTAPRGALPDWLEAARPQIAKATPPDSLEGLEAMLASEADSTPSFVQKAPDSGTFEMKFDELFGEGSQTESAEVAKPAELVNTDSVEPVAGPAFQFDRPPAWLRRKGRRGSDEK